MKPRSVCVFIKSLSQFADSGVDAVVGIQENVFAPDSFEYFVPRYQLPRALSQEEQQVEGNSFEVNGAASTTEHVCAPIELEILEKQPVRRHFVKPPVVGSYPSS